MPDRETMEEVAAYAAAFAFAVVVGTVGGVIFNLLLGGS